MAMLDPSQSPRVQAERERHAGCRLTAMTERAERLMREIRQLPRTEQLRLVEQVVHELAEADTASGVTSVIGLFADEPELIESACEEAMRARERDPLRLPGG